MERAVIYCRTNSGSQVSIENQEKACRKYAKENDYAVEKVFIDRNTEGVSVDTFYQLHSLIGYLAVTSKRPCFLIVATIDRLGRNLLDVAYLLETLTKLEIKVLSADRNQQEDKSPAHNLQLNIVKAFTQYEKDLRSERTRQSMRKHKKGNSKN